MVMLKFGAFVAVNVALLSFAAGVSMSRALEQLGTVIERFINAAL